MPVGLLERPRRQPLPGGLLRRLPGRLAARRLDHDHRARRLRDHRPLRRHAQPRRRAAGHGRVLLGGGGPRRGRRLARRAPGGRRGRRRRAAAVRGAGRRRRARRRRCAPRSPASCAPRCRPGTSRTRSTRSRAVPRTLSGKKLEVPVKRILTGTPVETAAAQGRPGQPGVAGRVRGAGPRPGLQPRSRVTCSAGRPGRRSFDPVEVAAEHDAGAGGQRRRAATPAGRGWRGRVDQTRSPGREAVRVALAIGSATGVRRREVVAVRPYLRRCSPASRPARSRIGRASGCSDEHEALAGGRRRLVDPVGGGEEHVRPAPSASTTSTPADQQPSSTAAVCQCGGSRHAGPVAGPEADAVDQQVGGLGDPVGEGGAGQLGALAGRVVVPGQQRSRRIAPRPRRRTSRAMSSGIDRRYAPTGSIDRCRVVTVSPRARRRPGVGLPSVAAHTPPC